MTSRSTAITRHQNVTQQMTSLKPRPQQMASPPPVTSPPRDIIAPRPSLPAPPSHWPSRPPIPARPSPRPRPPPPGPAPSLTPLSPPPSCPAPRTHLPGAAASRRAPAVPRPARPGPGAAEGTGEGGGDGDGACGGGWGPARGRQGYRGYGARRVPSPGQLLLPASAPGGASSRTPRPRLRIGRLPHSPLGDWAPGASLSPGTAPPRADW